MKTSVLSVALALAPAALAADWTWEEAEGKSIRFTSVPGYFLQDDEATDPTGFDYAQTNFGLIEREYPTDKHFDPAGERSGWERLENWLNYLNKGCRADGSVQYKLLFMGRHGQGYHNAAESHYGTPAWNCYWSLKEGNGTAIFADALLTAAGEAEALKANAYFRSRHDELNMPHFETYYASPLARCGETANLTFSGIPVPEDRPFAPIVMEGFREHMTPHTCNWRRDKADIAAMFPYFTFEDGFTEKDQLWTPEEAETDEAFTARAKKALDDVFRSDDKTWISISAHSGAITRLLRGLNHRPFRLATGQIIAVMVKAEAIPEEPTPTFDTHQPYSSCDNGPPIESTNGQCVCSTTTTGLPQPTGGDDECDADF